MTLADENNKKTTLGWVVNGGRRHAAQQGELIPRAMVLEMRVFLCDPSQPENNNHHHHNKHAYAGQLNSFTPLRVLLVLHDDNNNHKQAYAGQLNSLAGSPHTD
jgi:hypothetical protein